jgi:hypothetical protein
MIQSRSLKEHKASFIYKYRPNCEHLYSKVSTGERITKIKAIRSGFPK